MYFGRGQRKINDHNRRPGDQSALDIQGPYLNKAVDISPELIIEYQNKSKNPVSVVQEYCAQKKLKVSYEEEFGSMTTYGGFGCKCFIEGVGYQPGQGGTKKAAKTDAAVKAIEHILKYGRIILQNKPPLEEETNAKHPVSILYEYAAKHKFNVTIKDDDKCDEGFRASVYKDNEFVCCEFAHNKQEAKKKAGATALSMFIKREEQANQTHFDIMESLALEKLYRSNIFHLPTYRFAAFIVIKDIDDRGTCVSIATGDCCPSEPASMDGRSIIDGHAIIMARRSFVKYLYGELNECLDMKDSIFEVVGDKFHLKPKVSIHLYSNDAPCGDALAFTHESPTVITQEEWNKMISGEHKPKYDDKNRHGKLRLKNNIGTCTIGLGDTRREYRVMSCSDKMLKWMVVGVQGALLAKHVKPIYINSVTLGNNFEIETLVRAICCRYDDQNLAHLLMGVPFSSHHPFVGRVSCYNHNIKQRTINQIASLDEKENFQKVDEDFNKIYVKENSQKFVAFNQPVNETINNGRNDINQNDKLSYEEDNNFYSAKSVSEFDNLGFNICSFDEKIEIIDIKDTGKTYYNSPFKSGPKNASRLCKAAFLHKYRQLLKRIYPQQYIQFEDKIYAQVKQSSEDYQKAKEYFEENLYYELSSLSNHKLSQDELYKLRWRHQPKEFNQFIK